MRRSQSHIVIFTCANTMPSTTDNARWEDLESRWSMTAVSTHLRCNSISVHTVIQHDLRSASLSSFRHRCAIAWPSISSTCILHSSFAAPRSPPQLNRALVEEFMLICCGRWSLLIGLVVIVALSVGAYFLSPKGENQTYVVHFSSASAIPLPPSLPGWIQKLTE